jgi:hypothetical protein
MSEPIFDDNTGIALLSFTVGSTGNPDWKVGEGVSLVPGNVTGPSWFDKIASTSANLEEITLLLINDVSNDAEGVVYSTSATEYESFE